MKEEIKHFKSLLRQGSLRHMNILLDNKFQKELQIIIKDYEKLQQENEKLKKQLENKYEKVGTLTSELLYEENTKLIHQQKEFINYLQEELNVQIQEESIGCETINKRYILEEILQKHKEIIGDDK
jgi:hypothetical protein